MLNLVQCFPATSSCIYPKLNERFLGLIGCCRLAAKLCPTVLRPNGLRLPGFSVHGILLEGYWSGLPCSSPGDLCNPGIEPRSPALQVDSSPLNHQGLPFKKCYPLGDLKNGCWFPHSSGESLWSGFQYGQFVVWDLLLINTRPSSNALMWQRKIIISLGSLL